MVMSLVMLIMLSHVSNNGNNNCGLVVEAFSIPYSTIQGPTVVAKSSHTLKMSTSDDDASSSSPSLVLYGHPGTRSPLVNWGAYEMNLELKMAPDLSANPHPFGQIPCLTDAKNKDVVVFESGAILQYLHDLSKGKTKSWTPAQSAAITSWITWANASLDPICFLETPDGKVYDTGLKQPNKRIDVVERLLASNQYLLGDGEDMFSLADVAVASYLLYVLQFFPGVDISRWPNLIRYMKDCASRPAYAQAFGKNVQGYLVEKLEAKPKESGKLFGMF